MTNIFSSPILHLCFSSPYRRLRFIFSIFRLDFSVTIFVGVVIVTAVLPLFPGCHTFINISSLPFFRPYFFFTLFFLHFLCRRIYLLQGIFFNYFLGYLFVDVLSSPFLVAVACRNFMSSLLTSFLVSTSPCHLSSKFFISIYRHHYRHSLSSPLLVAIFRRHISLQFIVAMARNHLSGPLSVGVLLLYFVENSCRHLSLPFLVVVLSSHFV